MSEQQQQPQFAIEKIYIKDLSFESPMAPQVFTQPFQSSLDVQFKVEHQQVGEQHYHVSLLLTVTVRLGEQTAFLIEIDQAGLFLVKGFDADNLAILLNVHCPTLLFPYARETIASLSLKGGFPPLELQPIHFDALYVQQMQAQAQQQEQAQQPVQEPAQEQ